MVVGPDADRRVLRGAADALAESGAPAHVDVVSVHRMPEVMVADGREATRPWAALAGRAAAARPSVDGCPRRATPS